MTAPVVDLTPANANYVVGIYVPVTGSAPSTPTPITSGTPIDVDGTDLLFGAEHARFELAENTPAYGSHGLKTPPTAITCKLVSANVLIGANKTAPLGDHVFIANDGRIVFRPNIVAAILDAAPDDLDDITGISIEAIITPVYQNPTGATPAYVPTNALINITIDSIDFSAFTNADLIDRTPYIYYNKSTSNTPATIGPDPMA